MDSLLETLRNGGDSGARRDRKKKKRIENTVSVAVKAQDLLTSLREDDGQP